jgi:hypothetical protein
MKKVSISHVYNGIFYDSDKKYEYVGFANTRFICREIDHPENEMQFSAYSTVEIDDEEAPKVLFYLEDVLRRKRCEIVDIEEGIRMLKNQGVTEKLA